MGPKSIRVSSLSSLARYCQIDGAKEQERRLFRRQPGGLETSKVRLLLRQIGQE
jgi:hypothetical protein